MDCPGVHIVRELIVSRDALKKNLAVLKNAAEGAVLYAVLSGDGLGLGAGAMARALRDEGIVRFAISEPEEAAAIRKAGLVDEEILMLRSTTDRVELERLIDLNVVCTIGSTDAGLALNGVAEGRSTVAEAHIQVDTGMGFGGFFTGELSKIKSIYQNLPNVAVSGVYTQFHVRKAGDAAAQAQMDQFRRVVADLQAAGFETGTVHAAGSYALLHCDYAKLSGARVGSALLGRGRRNRDDGLVRVGYGQVDIEDIRWVPKGGTVGSEQLIRLKKATRVAVLPVGYQNGFGVGYPKEGGLLSALRRWRNARRFTVKLGNQRLRIIGRIGAIETLVDVTDSQCVPGETVVFDIDPLYARGFTIRWS